MRILYAGNKERGALCLKALVSAGHTIVAAIVHASPGAASPAGLVADTARALGIPVLAPKDVNDPATIAPLRELAPDLGVLSGYRPIVNHSFIDLPRAGCINLHGGKLPQYRGCSPMNWALMNGERAISLSIIQVGPGVDTGAILTESSFPVSVDETIKDVLDRANALFPDMLVDVVSQIEKGTVQKRLQDESQAAYWPLRFPNDGFILWDMLSARHVHNRIRALTSPFPGAFSFLRGQRVNLHRSKPAKATFRGEPGRIYLKNAKGLLVSASDECLWITQATFAASGQNALTDANRYDQFATVKTCALQQLLAGEENDILHRRSRWYLEAP